MLEEEIHESPVKTISMVLVFMLNSHAVATFWRRDVAVWLSFVVPGFPGVDRDHLHKAGSRSPPRWVVTITA